MAIKKKKAAKAKAAPKAKTPTQAKAGASKRKASKLKKGKLKKGKDGVVRLSGGNPQIAKGDGDGPVQAYIAAMPGWQKDLGKRIDALIVRTVPKVQKAVKWNSPFYGAPGKGWIVSFHVFTRYLKVTFFAGAHLKPVPPGPSKDKNVRYLDIHEDDVLDEKQLARWLKQAAARPGWIT